MKLKLLTIMRIKQKITFGIIILFLSFISCEQKLDERYIIPEEYSMTIYKTLQENESYSLFVDAIDQAGLTRQVDGRAALTVFAPNNEAVTKWLDERSVSKIVDADQEQLELMVKSHIVENIFNEQQLRKFGYNVIYKVMTTAEKKISTEIDVKNNRVYTIHHQKKMMPVFSPEVFQNEGIQDPGANYSYIMENDYNNRLMFANTYITEFNILCTNGVLYYVNDVVNTIDNFETVLDNNDDYSLMYEIYQHYARYSYNSSISQEYSQISGDSIFTKNYYNVPRINTEHHGQTLMDKMTTTASLFAVKNNQLENYLNETFVNITDGASSIADINQISLGFLLRYLSADGMIAWPEKIQNRNFRNDFGSFIQFDIDTDVDFVKYASNGLMYGLNEMPEITLFSSIMQLPFTSPVYNYFLHAAEYANIINHLTDQRFNYMAFIPHNNAFTDMGIILDVGDPDVLGDETFQVFNYALNQWQVGWPGRIRQLIQNHVIKDFPQELTEEWVLAETLNDFGLVLVSEEGVIGGGNQYAGEIARFENSAREASNGQYYTVDRGVKLPAYNLGEVIRTNPDFMEFNKLVGITGGWRILNGRAENPAWLPPNRYNVFIPSNDVIQQALDDGLIPVDPNPDLTEEQLNDPNISLAIKYEPLVKWLKYYFVGLDGLFRTQYILPTDRIDGTMDTALIDEERSMEEETVVFHKLELKFNQSEQKIIGKDGREAHLLLEGTALSNNALIYKIDNIVNYE